MSVLGLLLLSGCASVLHGDMQQVHVTVLCKDRVVPAACAAQNAKGFGISGPRRALRCTKT